MQNLRFNSTLSIKNFQYVPILLGTFFLCGCAPIEPQVSSSAPSTLSTPKWVYEPSKDGKIGGVGISKPHFNGKTAQRMLVISRALDEIARQMGVEVTSVQKITTIGTSQNTKTELDSYSIQTSSGKVIIAKIQSFWEDTSTDELYVWMVVE